MENLVVDPLFWKSKKVFLTGHTGFKGSWLSLWLNSMGAKVTGYSLKPTSEPSLFEQAQVSEVVDSILNDVCDLNALKAALEKSQAEIVIHMAAQALVRYSYQNPVETFATNVMGTVNLLEAVRSGSTVKAVVIVTSDKCYENKEWPWGYRENEPMGGYDPYSNSKGCAELVAASYRSSFFNPKDFKKHKVAIGTARAGNVIGGGDWSEDRLIPDIMRAIAAGKSVQIRSPKAIRPWQHVLEPLGGYLTLAEKLYIQGPEFAEAWNFGPQDADAKEVEWIVKALTRLWGQGASYVIETDASAVHEAHYLKLDCSKAKSKLGWQPRWDLNMALAKIVEWNQVFIKNPQQIKNMTLLQIEEYSKTQMIG